MTVPRWPDLMAVHGFALRNVLNSQKRRRAQRHMLRAILALQKAAHALDIDSDGAQMLSGASSTIAEVAKQLRINNEADRRSLTMAVEEYGRMTQQGTNDA